MTPPEALARHIAHRPLSPGPVGADHPQWVAYCAHLQSWVNRKSQLELKSLIPENVEVSEVPEVPEFKVPAPRKRSHRPAWAGATPGYMAQAARESRERRGCCDCNGPRLPKRSRCMGCQEKNEEVKARVKSDRRKAIRAGLRQRTEKA